MINKFIYIFQIPQFIIDDSAVKSRPCRVICCQPRRIAAISMADRVSNERGESIGMSTGYQVRLESWYNLQLFTTAIGQNNYD